jgi:hypothetical protein
MQIMSHYGSIEVSIVQYTPVSHEFTKSGLGRVVKLVYTLDSKSCGRKTVRVQVPPRPPIQRVSISSFFVLKAQNYETDS